MAGRRDRYEEAIRLYVETSGDREVAKLADQLTKLGDGADASAGQAQALVEELDKLANIGNNIRKFTEMKAAIADTGTALDKAQEHAAELRREFDQAEAPTRKLQRAMERADASVEKLTKQQNRQQAEFGRSSNALRAAGVDTENLSDAYAELQGRMGGLGARAADVAEGMERTGKGSEKAARGLSLMERASKGAGKSLGAIAVRLTAVAATATAAVAAMASAGTAALFTGAIRSAATLEDALSQVRAVSGATAEEMVALKEAAEAGGASTRFSTLEAAQGLGELARATGSASTAIATLPAALNLAQAAGIGVSEAAVLMTTTLTQFGLGADQATRVADVMAKEVNATTDSMEGLGNALTYSAPLAKQLGLDLEDTAAILGVLADQGFRGERAGTALRNVFSQMSDPASTFSAALREIGIESTDFATVIGELAEKGERGRDALLSLDAAARPAITALVDSGSAKLAELEASLRSASGEAARTAAVMGENVPGALEAITDSFDRSRRSLVEPLLEPLQKELIELSKELEEFAQSPEFEEIKGALKTLFVESAQAARDLIEDVDFAALATNIREFATDADGSLTAFKENVGEIATAVSIIGDTVSVVFNAVQAAIFAVAGVVTKVVAQLATAIDTLSGPTRKVLDFLGILEDGPTALGNFAGGMDAVSDEFAKRMVENTGEFIDAAKNFGDGVGEAGAKAAAGMDTATASSGQLADASKDVATAAEAATAALAGQAVGAVDTAATTSTAAVSMEANAERLKKAFSDMGIQSQVELSRAADAAKRNFELIREAAGTGAATAEDARRAFAAYADAARAAAADSDATIKQRVEGELRVQAAVAGVVTSLDKMGDAGKQAGIDVSEGASRAAESFGAVVSAADSAAVATAAVADSANASATAMEFGSKEGQQFALSMYSVSEAALEAYGATNRLAGSQLWTGAVNRVTDQINAQGEALSRQVEQLQAANAEFDEMAQRRSQLSQQFDLLGDGEIEKLLQAERQLESNRKRAAQERERERQDAQARTEADAKRQQDEARAVAKEVAETTAPALEVQVPKAPATSKVPLEVVLKVDATGAAAASALTLSQAQIQQISRALLPMLVTELERRRMASR